MDEGIYKIIWDNSKPFYPDEYFVWDDIKKTSLDYVILFKIPENQKIYDRLWGGFCEVYVKKTDSGFTIIDYIGPRMSVTRLEDVDMAIINRCDIYHGKGVKSGLEKVAELDQLDEKSFAYLRFYDINLK
ncbi:MAG: hypothetical protein Q8R37_01825 [Nanoarchaeota archaeon]|nr:hypothetical protein [Nanoarchaeota archaeon]